MNTTTPHSQAPRLPPERSAILADLAAIDEKIRVGGRASPRMSTTESKMLYGRRDDLLARYFAVLPVYALSRCPHCDAPLLSPFDPWGFDGPWWQEKRAGLCPPPAGCEHFRVLTGAVALHGPNVHGGTSDAAIGADAPFVIPNVLELPTMIAVAARVAMAPGHQAFPIAYFSTQPPPFPGLANPWTRTSCTFKLPDGRSSFCYPTDPWDFNLSPWVVARKLRWIDPDSPAAALADDPTGRFPFLVPGATQVQQIVAGDRLLTRRTPNNEKINPFGD